MGCDRKLAPRRTGDSSHSVGALRESLVGAGREAGKGVGALGSRAGQGLREGAIPVPPRGFWAKTEHGHKVPRPRLPDLKPGEAEVIVVHLPAATSNSDGPA
jgi:hypothetical protein